MSNDTKRQGAALRALRLQCDPPMRQGALAERVNLTPAMISQIENGNRRMSIALLCRAAECLACHLPMTKQQIVLAIVMPEEETTK